MDIPARVRRGHVGRWEDRGPPDDPDNGPGTAWFQAIHDSDRRDRQGMGEILGIRLRRECRLRAAAMVQRLEQVALGRISMRRIASIAVSTTAIVCMTSPL